ncbi:hypothetical protein [Enterococcus pallens]|uniref:Transposase TnpC homeodomain domain-containing protein n=1 Tax=Enterococcus pallens ATCC BAA-351 TaxID=1158607 RepID=R2SDY0_9ENTE|nr:hypothetical protein [Enterococcus pallens]EOH86349.1 hypothetical protein UAU_05271 [Enterococcus pallens ATCC BAA-351]EOU09430.1 hypothetical protein I588_05163 [Enterococcus pallens ATCC BAA-351]OJG77573.1 hypothetical protein RV10_GL002407 [Enterococcus pallens]
MAKKVNKSLEYNKLLEKKNKEIKELSDQLVMALDQIQYLQEQLFSIQRQMYGRKKEDIPSVDGQTDLFDNKHESFNEPEHTGQESQEIVKVKGFRRAKPKGKKAVSLAHLPANHKHYRLEGEACLCETCGTHMAEVGSTIVREEPFFIPAHIETTRL